MDFKRLILLLFLIALGLFVKEKYDERKADRSAKKNVVAVKGVSTFFDKKVKEGEKTLQEVLGSSTSFVTEQASKSASAVTSIILEKSSEKIVEQINKLPDDTRKEVKEAVCR